MIAAALTGAGLGTLIAGAVWFIDYMRWGERLTNLGNVVLVGLLWTGYLIGYYAINETWWHGILASLAFVVLASAISYVPEGVARVRVHARERGWVK